MLAITAAAVLCGALILPAQSTHDLGIGKLLVAKRDAGGSGRKGLAGCLRTQEAEEGGGVKFVYVVGVTSYG